MAVSRKTRGKSLNAPTNKIENAVKKMTPEIYFARKLASNEKKIRDRSLKKLRRWIAARSAVPDGIATRCLIWIIVYLILLCNSFSILWWWTHEIMEGTLLLHVDVWQALDTRRSCWNHFRAGSFCCWPQDRHEIYFSCAKNYGQPLVWYWHLEDGQVFDGESCFISNSCCYWCFPHYLLFSLSGGLFDIV